MIDQPTNDIEAAEQTYSGFVHALKWIVPLLAAFILFLIIIIS